MYITQRHSRIQRHLGGVPGLPTFSRSGVAYDPYTGAAYADGQPRFPVVGGRQGVMVEEGGGNLCLYSNDIAGAGWSLSGGGLTLTSNYGLAPNGQLEADRFQSSIGVYGDRRQAITWTAGQSYTASFWLKAATGSSTTFRVLLIDSTGAAIATLDLIAVTDQWQRFTFSGTCANSGAGTIRLATPSTGASVAVDVLIWGVQVENKAYATSGIKTEGATATRNPETLTIPTAGVLNLSQFAILVETYLDGDLATAASVGSHNLFDTRLPWLAHGVSLNRVAAGNTWRVNVQDGTNTTQLNWAQTLSAGRHVFGVRGLGASYSLWADGASRAANNSVGTLPSILADVMTIGCRADGVSHWNSPVTGVHIFPTALPDSLMAQFTSGAPIPRTPYHSLYLPLDGSLATYGRGFSLADYQDRFGGNR